MKIYDNTGIPEALSREIHSKFYQTFDVGTIEDSEIMLCSEKNLENMPKKKFQYFVANMTNTDHIDEPIGVEVINLKGEWLGHITSTAEHTLYLMMCLVKRLSRNEKPGHVLNRKNVYIIGNKGRIGRQLFRGLSALNMRVYGSDVGGINLEALRIADFITVNVSVGRHTAPVLSQKELVEIKDGAYIINTARARAVDHPAILAHLHRLGGFASDFRLPAGFNNFDNVFDTNHTGGYCIEDLKATSDICYQKLMRRLDSEYKNEE